MFNFIKKWHKEVSKKQLGKKLSQLIAIIEECENFTLFSLDYKYAGFTIYYSDKDFFEISDREKGIVYLKKTSSGIVLSGHLNEEVNYCKLIDSIIHSIKQSEVNTKKCIKKG